MTRFRPASSPRPARDVRVLVVDGASGSMRVATSGDVPSLFDPGDLVVVNDAATLPASIAATTEDGSFVELRLVAASGERRWTVTTFGEGDHRTRTEDRDPPPALALGARLVARRGELVATVISRSLASPRLVDVELSVVGSADAPLSAIWAALYRVGRPVQYAHVPERLALWDVQNVFAGRPWAMEMPSAGRLFRAETFLALERRGVAVARVTHAAGLSSVGDPAVDALLPLPERFEVTEPVWEAIARTRRGGGRVVAVGTSVVRALEGGARANARAGVTDLRIGAGTRRAIVDAVVTGVHDEGTSHHELLFAFATPAVLARVQARAADEGLLGHEMGDACLVWGQPREKVSASRPRSTDGGPERRAPGS